MSDAVGTGNGPPIPNWLFRWVINPIMILVLRSPFHGLVSHALIILQFEGHKSGDMYRFPVGYTRQDGTLLVFTDHDWSVNLQGGAPVTVRLKGEERAGHAEVTRDREQIAQALFQEYKLRGREFLERRHQIELEPGQTPTPESLTDRDGDEVLVRIELNCGRTR